MFAGIAAFIIREGYDLLTNNWQGWEGSGKLAVTAGLVFATGGYTKMVSSSGIMFGNTVGMIESSLIVSSVNSAFINPGADVTVSFGSYNISQNEAAGLWTWRQNTSGENFGYVLGALVNFSDILTLSNSGEATLHTSKGDALGGPSGDKPHSSISTEGSRSQGEEWIDVTNWEEHDTRALISWGPDVDGEETNTIFGPIQIGRNDYPTHMGEPMYNFKDVTISGLNVNTLEKYGQHLNNISEYGSFSLINSCSMKATWALNISGVYNVGLLPASLHVQMYLRSIGVRPFIFSYYMQNY